MPKAQNLIKNLRLSEVSVCDDPANDEAKMVIVKSRGAADQLNLMGLVESILEAIEAMSGDIVAKAIDGNENPDAAAAAEDVLKEMIMDLEQLTKALGDAEAAKQAAEAAKVAAETELAKAKEALATKDAEIAEIKKSKGETKPEPSEDEILKSLPESIRKRLEEQDAEIKKARDREAEAERQSFITKAKDLKVGDADKVGDLLHRIAKGKTEAGDADLVERILKQAGKLADTAGIFKTLGTGTSDEGNPGEVLINKAKARVAASGNGMTFEQAYEAEVMANPAIYQAYLEQRRA